MSLLFKSKRSKEKLANRGFTYQLNRKYNNTHYCTQYYNQLKCQGLATIIVYDPVATVSNAPSIICVRSKQNSAANNCQ